MNPLRLQRLTIFSIRVSMTGGLDMGQEVGKATNGKGEAQEKDEKREIRNRSFPRKSERPFHLSRLESFPFQGDPAGLDPDDASGKNLLGRGDNGG